jgi:hypothetical protein
MHKVTNTFTLSTLLIVGGLLWAQEEKAFASDQHDLSVTDVTDRGTGSIPTMIDEAQLRAYLSTLLNGTEVRDQDVQAAKKVMNILGLNHIQDLRRDHFRDGVALLQMGFADFDQTHLSAIEKLRRGSGNKRDLYYRAPMKYDDIKPTHVEAMMLLNHGRTSTSLTPIDQPTQLELNAAVYFLGMNDLKDSFGDRDVEAFAWLSVPPHAVYNSPPIYNPTIDQIKAVASLMAVTKRGEYIKELVWAIRQGFALNKPGTVPNALARIVMTPGDDHPFYVFEILWTRPGFHFHPDVAHLMTKEQGQAQGRFTVAKQNVDLANRQVDDVVIFMNLKKSDNDDTVLFNGVAQHKTYLHENIFGGWDG